MAIRVFWWLWDVRWAAVGMAARWVSEGYMGDCRGMGILMWPAGPRCWGVVLSAEAPSPMQRTRAACFGFCKLGCRCFGAACGLVAGFLFVRCRSYMQWPSKNPHLSAIGLAGVAVLFVCCRGRGRLHRHVFVSAIGEVALAHAAIAANSRVRHMCNGDLQ